MRGCSRRRVPRHGRRYPSFRQRRRLGSRLRPLPVLSQSGKVRYSRSATGGEKSLKWAFYQAAFCSIQRDPTSRAFHDRKRADGKQRHQALIALARRKVNALYVILRDRRPYDPANTLSRGLTPA
ncbi:transposase [Streptomyces sp. NBC_00268]|uniref:transposase n=1 Tax=Streptomyces sp. NBC_00268 TaxID=2975695 RepID=UPI00225B678D|nr:transposase [Streptomyces sp. NBC_00268]MCX5190707.1 transposase [Streptomyces sp. NBC_00268]